MKSLGEFNMQKETKQLKISILDTQLPLPKSTEGFWVIFLSLKTPKGYSDSKTEPMRHQKDNRKSSS